MWSVRHLDPVDDGVGRNVFAEGLKGGRPHLTILFSGHVLAVLVKRCGLQGNQGAGDRCPVLGAFEGSAYRGVHAREPNLEILARRLTHLQVSKHRSEHIQHPGKIV